MVSDPVMGSTMHGHMAIWNTPAFTKSKFIGCSLCFVPQAAAVSLEQTDVFQINGTW
jgi:hypothetical protein